MFSMTNLFPHPLSAVGEERVAQRSEGGVSRLRYAYFLNLALVCNGCLLWLGDCIALAF